MALRGSHRYPLAFALAAACATGCASRQEIVVHSEPIVVAESDEHLVADLGPLEDGSISLKVYRARDRIVEQRYWKMQAGKQAETDGTASVGVAPAPAGSPSGDALGQLAGLGVVAVGAIVVGIGYGVYLAFDALFTGIRSVFPRDPPADVRPMDDFVVVRRPDLCRRLSPQVYLVRPDTGQILDLGPQPAEGYRVDSAQIDRLGGRGVVVVIRDEKLSLEISLGTPR